jgi:magnesium transporter
VTGSPGLGVLRRLRPRPDGSPTTSPPPTPALAARHEDLTILTQEFGLHPLADEDTVRDHERPKLDRYPDHLFLSSDAVHLDHACGELTVHELAAFVLPQALITVRKDEGFDVDGLVN